MKYFAVLLALAVATACSGSTPGTASNEASPEPTSAESVEPAAPEVAPPETASSETSAPVEEPVAANGPVTSGPFESAEHPTAGTATIVQEGDQYYVEFSDDFSTDPGPDLFVVLHQSNDFFSITSPPTYGIEEDSYVSLAPLEAVNGAQRYAIPASVDVDEFGSVAVWCRQFNATFGAANLSS
ncbi:MAG: DM13 domain-containing protein [Elainellaceae cyanobacterium]